MQKLDEIAIRKYGIPSLILMENAGRGIADMAQKMVRGKRILVFCGKGNNGGDGLVAARHLSNRGFKASVVLFGKPNELTPDSQINFKIIKKMGIPVTSRIHSMIKKSDLIIDAIFGTGLKRTVEGIYYDSISLINQSKTPILAVDVPSGLNSENGNVLRIAIKATKTGTLAVPKRGLNVGKGPIHAGKVEIIDISIPRKLISRYTDAPSSRNVLIRDPI